MGEPIFGFCVKATGFPKKKPNDVFFFFPPFLEQLVNESAVEFILKVTKLTTKKFHFPFEK